MAAALALLGRAAGLVTGVRRLLRVPGGGSAEKSFCRGISSDERPKRPLTGYFRFLKENHSGFKQKNPEMSNMELMRKIAGAWKALPASQKQELTVLGKPKRPRTGFNIFVSEHFKESEGISPVAKLKQLFDGWQKLSDSQKQPYLQLAEDDKVRYENEMTLWETKMIELGREDLIRSRKQRPKNKSVETAKQAETAKASSHENKAKLKLEKSEE
ncbi:transcription factor A, mitochondrial isoform X2 [Strix aluco]|uniref:transcription factor A, mitochondrial isoform X2 n=1 Tax=Strix aluco TaxID=111821 RepID=UPI003DA21A27